nr:glycosyltransferase [uncultured Halomonas sp.]
MAQGHWMVLSDGARPTEDIYFLRSVAPWLRARGMTVRRLDTRRWRSPGWCWPWLERGLRGAHVLVCRSLGLPWIEMLERLQPELASLYYLIDDDIPAAAKDPRLPIAYRQRMGRISREQQPRLLDLADEVVACSHPLAERFVKRHRCVSVLTPPLIAALPPQSHFEEKGWRLGFHGTRAHLPDIEHIAPALVSIHDRNPDLSLEIMLGQHTPAALAALPRVTTPAPLSWHAFRRYQSRRRLHIGIAPLWPTPFNAGKSHIKFLDIAAMGGVGIYSRRPPYTDIVTDGKNGLLAEDSPASWRSCLQRLLDHPSESRRMAARAADKARDTCDPARAQAFWWARR